MKIKVYSHGIKPTKGHPEDAGYDLYAPENIEVLPHNFSDRIDLGVAFEIPFGYCGLVVERSSQGKIGLSSVGMLVDFGYTGKVHITIVNHGYDKYKVKKGDRIGQIIFPAILNEDLEVVEEFDKPKTRRGDKAHGSTGK